MYIRFEDKEKGKRFTFFKKEREIKGEKLSHTDKSVFATLSEGVKTGENNGQPIWENDYWDAVFCGKAYEKALELKDKDRVVVTEMNIRNVLYRANKRSYPKIMVTEFYLPEPEAQAERDAEHEAAAAASGEEFIDIPDGMEDDLPFN